MKPTIAIIGGGIAGLSAGIYAQKSGFSATIYESQPIPGGECTGWTRQGYHLDNCVNWLTGSAPGSELYDIWVETGALENTPVVQEECLYVVEVNGKTVAFRQDLDRMEQELLAISPADKKLIREYIRAVDAVKNMSMPVRKPMDLMSGSEMMRLGLSMMKPGMTMSRYGKISCEAFAARFQSPILQTAFRSVLPQGHAMTSLLFSHATVAAKSGGFPKGGSLAMALRMAEKFKSLQGELRLSCPVREILTKNGKAVGLLLESGETIEADYVISACDTNVLFQKLLNGRHMDEYFKKRYDDPAHFPVSSSFRASFGVDADLAGYPSNLITECAPYSLNQKKIHMLGLRHFCGIAPEFSPAGKSVVVSDLLQYADDFVYWKKLSSDPAAYQAEKARVAQEIQARIEQRFPELAGKLTLLDTYTPVTFERYCGAYYGAYMCFIPAPGMPVENHPGSLPDVENLWLAGQWLQAPGGLPTALTTGRFAVQRLCAKENIPFGSAL